MPTDIPIQPVLVGVDGSDASLAAARYAATAAEQRGAPLLLVTAYEVPMYGYVPVGAGYVADDRPEIDQQLAVLAKQLREEYPDLAEITARQVVGGAAGALIAESRHAQLTVVGCRGMGGFAELMLGSASSQLVAHGHGPVIVVRPPVPDVESSPDQVPVQPVLSGPIVVGVDGSPAGQVALAFAVEEAHRRGTDVVAMHAFGIPPSPTRDAVEQADIYAQQVLFDAVAPWAHEPGVSIETKTLAGRTVEQAMIDASYTAGLIVVGSRGRGGFTGLLLGSVSQALVHHGHCPVAVVHAADR
jgi:nucleotide-binding universal stress UspA family protein